MSDNEPVVYEYDKSDYDGPDGYDKASREYPDGSGCRDYLAQITVQLGNVVVDEIHC